MKTYQPEDSVFYVSEDYVTRNSFAGQPLKEEKLPDWSNARVLLPKPVWENHDDAIACYDKAWELAFQNLRIPSKESRFVSNYIDTAFNDSIFMWDSAFILMFGKYGLRAFDFQQTLDNFYSKQHKDGFICREIRVCDGGDKFTRFDPISTGPDIMGWCEWEYYLFTGNKERLGRVFDPLMGYHRWLMKNRTWMDGTYWSSGWGCGMDNTPRLMPEYDVSYSHGHQIWVDTCFQAVLSAKMLIQMAIVLGRKEETGFLQEEIQRLEEFINSQLWDDATGFYYDKWKTGELNHVKCLAPYWGLLSQSVPKDRIEHFVAHLENEKEFNRPHRVPTLAACEKGYKGRKSYWCGDVWTPTNYMILSGLRIAGKDTLAYEIARNHLDHVVECFNRTGTLWENYAPEYRGEYSSDRADFVGWTGLTPISILLEYVFGIRYYAEENKIVWHVNLLEEHGVENYPIKGGKTIRLICTRRTDRSQTPIILTDAEDITIEVINHNKEMEA